MMFGKPLKNDAEILALPADAQALLAAHFGLGLDSTLTLGNQKSRFSDRAAAAMKALVQAGIVSDEKADDRYAESRTYRLTDHGKKLNFHKSMSWMSANGKFPITHRITGETT